jgi:hypothetical protein
MQVLREPAREHMRVRLKHGAIVPLNLPWKELDEETAMILWLHFGKDWPLKQIVSQLDVTSMIDQVRI